MKTWKTTPAYKSTSCGLAAIIAIGMAQAAVAAPSPSTWDLEQTLTPGASPTGTAPWESRHAIGTNCETDQGILSVPWSRDSGKLSGRNASTVDTAGGAANPVIFKNVSMGLSSPPSWGLTFGANQVGMTTSATRCAVLRFVAPADGMYKVSGEFFSPINQAPNTTNPATNKVMVFVRSGTQQSSGLVDKPAGIQSWMIPGAPVYALQAGQFIDFAVRDAGNGVINDVAMLSARVTWVDVLPPQPAIFKASEFDFEGAQGCAIEQGTNKLHCWGANGWGQLGRMATPGSNVAVLAQRIENYIGAHATGAAKNLQVGNRNVCIQTTGTNSVLCWGANNNLQSGMATGSQITTVNSPPYGVRDLTAQLGSTRVKIDGLTGCLINMSNQIQCWGYNEINSSSFGGILGWKNGSVFTGNHLPLADVPNVAAASQVAPGGTMTCAIVSATARVNCWGNTPWGASMLGGGGTPTLLMHPNNIAQTYVLTAPTTPLLQVQKIEVSGVRACALKAGGSLWCWGMNHTYGELIGAPMTGSTPNPPGVLSFATALPAPFNSGVTDFGLSSNGLCAVKGGQVYCLGRNIGGQLGKPPQTGTVEWRTPYAVYSGQANIVVDVTPIPSFTGVLKIKGGDRSFCALKTSGEIWCWGANTDGQLGAGLATGAGAMSAVPVRVKL